MTRVVDNRTKREIKTILTDTQDGTFARNWVLENQAGAPSFHAKRQLMNDWLVDKARN